jgi:hypothetical protein
MKKTFTAIAENYASYSSCLLRYYRLFAMLFAESSNGQALDKESISLSKERTC